MWSSGGHKISEVIAQLNPLVLIYLVYTRVTLRVPRIPLEGLSAAKETYLHRVGRTGRSEPKNCHEGIGVSFSKWRGF